MSLGSEQCPFDLVSPQKIQNNHPFPILSNSPLKFPYSPNPAKEAVESVGGRGSGSEREEGKVKKKIVAMAGSSSAFLLVCDFVVSCMWVWSGALIKMLVYETLGFGHDPLGEAVKCGLYVANMFFFARLDKITGGASYNPLTVLASAVSSDFGRFLFTVGARIPAQAVGSVVGVRLLIQTFPEIWHGPHLSVDIHQGALTEGFLTFVIVIISLGLYRNIPGSFYRKTWISSVSKVTLQILGSDLTGGCMNPATAMGWAYARGEHMTKEHIFVYWLAPVEATFLAVWTFRLLVGPLKELEAKTKKKSE